MIDRYTRSALTIIAAALVALVLQNVFPMARAQTSETCGSSSKNPCWVTAAIPFYVESAPKHPVWVAAGPREPLYVATPSLSPLEVKIAR
jgi:hypothetical protein